MLIQVYTNELINKYNLFPSFDFICFPNASNGKQYLDTLLIQKRNRMNNIDHDFDSLEVSTNQSNYKSQKSIQIPPKYVLSLQHTLIVRIFI